MTEQTLVAVYDTPAHAEEAARDLRAANVPAAAISQHAANGAGAASAPVQERGFWSSLFGGDTDDADTLGRSVAGGSTVVTVKVPAQQASQVTGILEKHNPIDFDERAASYAAAQTTTTRTETVTAAPVAAAAPRAAVVAKDDDTIKVMEERLVVGKRAVNNGGARVRSYVVETPVEELVTLHSETIHVERRPVTDGRLVTDADFRERSVEMQESSEEIVVGKEARVVEEISLRKEASDRVETVHDTVRSTKVDVEQAPAVETATTTTAATTKPAAAPLTPAAPLNPKR